MTNIIHLYNPPTTLPAAEVARRYGTVIYHWDAGSYVGNLRSAGWTGGAMQYVMASQANGAGIPYKNNLGGIYPNDHPAWQEADYLHNSSGARLYEVGWNGIKLYSMNPASSAWRAWAFPRFARVMQPWAGTLYLDNVDLHLHRLQSGQANGTGAIKEFGNNDATFRAAMLDYVRALCAHVRGALPAVRIVGNLISSYDAADEFDPFLAPLMLDGCLYEYVVGRWSNELVPASLWARQLGWVERATSAGRSFLAVAQGAETDTDRFRYCFASYLLVAHPTLTAFAYEQANYGHTWWYPEYDLDLGAPLGPRRPVAGTRWRREFERGYVEADPATAVGTIRATPPDTRIARVRDLLVQALAVLDEPAPVA